MNGEELLAQAVDGVITLDGDVTLTEALQIPANDISYTLNLNGKAITAANTKETVDAKTSAIIKNNGNLTINGDGSFVVHKYLGCRVVFNDGGNLTINGDALIQLTEEVIMPARLLV